MDRIVETMRDLNLQESWGEVIDVTEFMTDSTGFFNTNGLGAFTQIYDRADGRFRPVYTNESDLKLIRAMSWLLVEKVPMAQAWVNRLLDYTIGTGFDWTIKAEDKRLEKAVQLYVRETLDNSRWSSELERESYVREVADGEFLSELIYDDGQCLMVAREADELTEPAIKGELEDWIGIDFVPSWTFGVLTKQSLPERPIGYHFVRNSAGTDWDYVPAERVCLWKRNVRSRGKRGFSDFYKPHLYLLRADRVLTNTAEGAATQAAIAYIVEHRDGTQRQADNIVKRFAPLTGKVDPLTGLAQRRRRMLPGTRLDVPEGQQYKAGLLGSNNSDIYISVMEAALRLAGSVHAFPEGMLTGSYENNNFASALVAEGPFMQGRMAEQAQRKERMREMLLKIIRQGANKRRFAFAGFDTWEKIEQVLTVEVIPSRIIPMDPLKTAQALQIQKQNGWVSDKTCINELGRDIDTETANGLKVGSAEQQPGAAGQPGANKQEADQPNLGNVSKEDSSQWLGLSRLQWQRNRKAVTDVLTDYANGKTRRSVATVLLRSIGVPNSDIESILDDASDGQIDSLPESMTEAEKKTLNKPFRTPGGPKKFGVYVKNAKGNVIKLPFGDPKMRIKRNDPGKRRGFRARHNCQDPGPKWKARYWSCRFWSKPSVTKLLKESFQTGEVPWDGRTFVRESWLLKTNPRLLEVRCPTGKGGGIDNSCKRKNKASGSIETPSIKASEAVVANLLQYGHSPFSGILKKELLNAGATESGIDQFESLRDGHRFGGDQQAAADAKFAENVTADNDLGKTIRASIAIEEAAIEAWNGGVGQQHMDRLATEQMRHVEWMHKNGMIDTEDYPTPKSYFDEREAWQYKFEPMRFYRKGAEKAVMPTSTRSEGGQSHSVTGAAQPKFSPDRSWSYDELKSKGYRVLGGFGQAFGYQGENEIAWIKVPKAVSESFRGLREEKDGDGDGLVNDGKPSERPVDPNRDGGKKSFKTADDLRKAGFNVIGADRLNEIDPVAMTGLHDGLQELKQNFPGIEKAISGVKAEKLPADVPFTVRKSGASITVLIDPDQMKSAKFAKFSKQIEKSQKSGFLASREGFLGVMHHELGHVVDLAPFEMQYSWGVSAAKTFVKQNPPTSQQLQSRYAFQDKAKQNQEVWAEAYASWKTNKEPTEWQKKFNAIMDGRGKKESLTLTSLNDLLEEKDGDGDGFVNDGKPSERPVNDSDKPKKDVKEKNTVAKKDDSSFRAKFESLKEQAKNLSEEAIAVKSKLKQAKTHDETVSLSTRLHEIDQQDDAIRWNAATEYGAFHAENPKVFRALRDQQLAKDQQRENDNFKVLLEWANEVRMRPGVQVSLFNLSRGENGYDPKEWDAEEASRYTEKNSLEARDKYKSQWKSESGSEDHEFNSKVYRAYYNEPDKISENVLGDGSVSVPSKVQRGGADSALKSFMQTSAIAVQVDPSVLASIAQKGLLSASEGGKKGAGSKKTGDAKKRYFEIRRTREEELFGIPNKPEQSRPVYGLINNPDRLLSDTVWAASNYGTAQVVLKPSVKSRASYTIGDSLDDYRFGGITGAVNDPVDHSSVPPKGFYRNPSDADKNPSTTIAGKTAGEFKVTVRSDAGTRESTAIPQYIEAQIHGGVAPSDIAEIRIPRGTASPSAVKKLQKAGITVREIPPPPVKNFYGTIPTWENIGND